MHSGCREAQISRAITGTPFTKISTSEMFIRDRGAEEKLLRDQGELCL
jgi:hypothetical protein